MRLSFFRLISERRSGLLVVGADFMICLVLNISSYGLRNIIVEKDLNHKKKGVGNQYECPGKSEKNICFVIVHEKMIRPGVPQR